MLWESLSQNRHKMESWVETFSYTLKDPYVAFMPLRLRLCPLAVLLLVRAVYKRLLLPQVH